MNDQDDGPKVKVVDRRWFTSDGDLREPSPDRPVRSQDPPPPAPAEQAGDQTETPPPADANDAGPATEPETPLDGAGEGLVHAPGEPGFVELVDSLAQPAVAFLSGQVPGRGRDLNAAKYYIDLLGTLEAKTRGNLNLEEKSILDDVLYQLRSLYLAASR